MSDLAQHTADMLQSLRWGPDQAIINYEGEHVWLKQVTREEAVARCAVDGVRYTHPHGYITDCCPVASPCQRHGQMQAEDLDR